MSSPLIHLLLLYYNSYGRVNIDCRRNSGIPSAIQRPPDQVDSWWQDDDDNEKGGDVYDDENIIAVVDDDNDDDNNNNDDIENDYILNVMILQL